MATEKNKVVHCVQRQSLVLTTKPPTKTLFAGVSSYLYLSKTFSGSHAKKIKTYPIVGPMNGETTNAAIGTVLSSALHISAITPLPMLTPGLPKMPARNLQMIKVGNVFARPAPRMKNA